MGDEVGGEKNIPFYQQYQEIKEGYNH